MSEPTKQEPGSESQPELTPAEQQKHDEARVQGQLLVTDVGRVMQPILDVFGSSGSSGRTSFEGHELNAMIDLIENSKPEQLEEAGKALWDARDAIKKASQELKDFIGGVEWEGESGTAFRDWGNGLAVHADKLSEFADVAGTQITVAGTGLASVRNSLPPRDSRLIRKSPDEVEAPKRIEGNAEYEAAVKVEKDRQEAINQANRLASYYAVSEETLAAQEPPRFEKKLDVAMPRPRNRRVDSDSDGSSSESDGTSRGGVSGVPERSAAPDASGAIGHAVTVERPGSVEPVLDKGTSTEINSVATPTAPANSPITPSPAPTTSPAPGGNPPPVANGFVNPVTSNSRPQGAPAPRTVSQSGFSGARQNGPTASGPAANSRAGSPVGRPAPMTGGPASGNPARAVGGPQSPTAGRPAVTGGRPVAAGHSGTSPATGPRAGRASGITGGTPQRAVPGGSNPGGARGVPRGTVIGAGGAARPGGPAGGIGQRGVLGAGGTNGASRPGGRGTPSTKGVVGTPRGGAGGPGGNAKGFTAGGAGLVRGPGRRDSRDEEQDDGTPRPDYLTEDRETWEAGRRGAAPPVIE
ncbi:hypothetical protein [Streptomyces pratensis]|uniref:hypothetical protein n=1 Tax=Streptomyces pratensis TaxID=1169025 RepID=UPI001933103F|nr:hypothetical protein [Streptomyces pratensis]